MTAGATPPAALPDMRTVPLLVAFLGAPLIWAVHLGLSYFFVVLDCGTGWEGGRSGIVIATIACALAALAVGVHAWRLWQRLGTQSSTDSELDPPQTREFLVLGGAVLAPLFAGTIVLAGISPLFLPLCV